MRRAHVAGALGLLLVLALAGAVTFVLSTSSDPPIEAPRSAPDSAPEPAAPLAEPANARTAVPASEDEPAPLSAATVRGRVVDASGASVPAIEVGLLVPDGEPPVVAKCDGSGFFQLRAAELPCSIVVVDPKWTTLKAGEVGEDAPLARALVVAAPAVAVRGVVVDPQGRPLAGARVGIRVEGRSSAVRAEWETESAPHGGFRIARAPGVLAARLSTRLAEFKTDERTLDLPPASPLQIVLVPQAPEGPVLTGTVVRQDGSSVSGATVTFGSAQTRTDIHGRFRLACGWYDERTPLVAAAKKHSPAVLAGYGAGVECVPGERPPVEIVLPGAALSIAGRVVLPNGKPVKGWRVELADPTPVDPGGLSEGVVESLGDGRTHARTDGSGGFELEGLADRRYSLLAYGRDRASKIEVIVRSDPVEAGTRDVVIETPDGFPGAPIVGRVLDTGGKPIEGALVGLGEPDDRDSREMYARQGPFRVRTDAGGRFEIQDVPRGLVYVIAGREGYLPIRKALESDAARSGLDFRLRDRRYVEFDGSAASPQPDLLRAGSAWRLDEGVSRRIAILEDVHEIVLYRGCRIVGRVPLALGAEETTRIVWP